MNTQITAISISRPVRELLRASGTTTARVLASFPEACNLLTSGGDLITLVLPTIGDGPLNIVVDAPFKIISRDTIAFLDWRTLRLGSMSVALDKARSWQPCPDWAGLADSRDQILARLPKLRLLASRQAPSNSLLAVIEDWDETVPGPTGSTHLQGDIIASRIMKAAYALALGWDGDREQLKLGAAQMAGLGCGLTPAGDDFLAGLMLWSWLAHPNPRTLCHDIFRAAGPRTTILSAALLRAAADGACSVAWHQVLAGLVGQASLQSAVHQVLAHGSTSGADALAGFLLIHHLHQSRDLLAD